jgi:hypothetical protein
LTPREANPTSAPRERSISAWPAQRDKAAWAAALFAVYPGFTQQPISVIYGQAFLLFALLFFSIALSAWAAARPKGQSLVKALAILLALLLSALFLYEYFFGLELLRWSCSGWFPTGGCRGAPG